MITRMQRTRLVERYISRRMSLEEERAFLTRMERDTELRRMVEAEQFVFRTLSADRDAIPAEHPRTRMRVFGLLASLAPAGASSVLSDSAQAAQQSAAVDGSLTGHGVSAQAGSTAAGGASTGVAGVVAGLGVVKTALVVLGFTGAIIAAAVLLPDDPLTSPEAGPGVNAPVERIAVPIVVPQEEDDPAPPAFVQEPSEAAPSDRTGIQPASRRAGAPPIVARPADEGAAATDSVRMRVKVTLPGEGRGDGF